MYAFGRTSLDRLADAHPSLQLIAHEAIKVIDLTVLETHRTRERQNRLQREGKSTLTWPYSKHNSYPSMAIDIAPWVNGGVPWSDIRAFYRMVGVLEAVAHREGLKIRSGLDWDRDWTHDDQTFNDGPHIELVQ